MSNLLVVGLIFLYTFQSAFCNLYAKKYPGKAELASPVYSVFYGLFVALGTFAFAGFSFVPTGTTAILGVICGVCLVAYNLLLIKAANLGPFSVTMIFNLSGGILLPLFWSLIHDGEKLSLWQIAAIFVMLVSFFFLNRQDNKSEQKISARFLLVVSLLGCANGVYGILINTAARVSGGTQNADMIITTYGTAAALALLLLAILAGKETFPAFRQTTKSFLCVLAASVSACAAINLLMYALKLINVAVLYAMDNGGVLVVSVLWSALILREKISKWKLIGLLLALGAIVALSVL